MIAEQLQAARAAHWRQQQPLLTLEDAQGWLGQHPLCLYLPRRAQLPAPAPSFVEASLGKPQTMPGLDAIEQAQGLLTRLTASGAVIPLNLLGSVGEQPDFLATREALPSVLSLRADPDWKHAPQKSSGHKVSPLVLELWKLLELQGSLTAAEARATLGRELTEAALLRALAELWQGLRISPVYSEDGQPARWEMMRVRHREALTTAAGTGQVTAISLLVSMYLQSVYAATSEEIEIFLSPVTSRSRVREAVRGLSATRQIHSLSMDAQTYYFLENGLPEFAAAAVPSAVEAAPAPIAVRPKRREHPLAPAPGAAAAAPRPVRPAQPPARSGWKSPQRAAGDAPPRRPNREDKSPGGFARAGASSRPATAGKGRPPFKAKSAPPAGGPRPWRPKTTTAGPSAPLRSGRDDIRPGGFARTGERRPPFKAKSAPPAGGPRPWRPKTTTAGPSAPLRSGRDDKKPGGFARTGERRPPFKTKSGPPAGGPRPWRPKTTTAGPSAPLRSGRDDKKPGGFVRTGEGRPPFKPRSGPPRSGPAGGPRPWRPKTTTGPSAPPRAGQADRRGAKPGGFARAGAPSRPAGKPGASFKSRSGPPRSSPGGGERRPPFKPRPGPPRSGPRGGGKQPGDYPRRKPDRKKPGA